MSVEERDRFLAEPRIAKLCYLREDGSPTVVPLWFEWDGKEARAFTSGRSPKIGHLERDPRVALSVETVTGEPEAWVTIEGQAVIEDGGWEVARRLAPRYYSEEKARQALASWEKAAGDWVTVRIVPEHIRSLA
ncbi:MAG: TIGR03618 family F420-dependent PPOX class oxidoreductase [Dehalococcoidia bacterium]